MKYKQALDLRTNDAFAMIDKLKKLHGVISCNAVTCEHTRIWYDNRKISVDDLLRKAGFKRAINTTQ